ncbi:hypothetical protein PanWU01x14_084060 [Parasponia andersonii]|uniref:Uncharacterized protein n=1 Tax=Parasponia andersonii TaxID=3476 RepID=A0A2P5D9I9_PARAD|nr:hypothetical protein PanWU01x14_084060 [Parasponia andersonii]
MVPAGTVSNHGAVQSPGGSSGEDPFPHCMKRSDGHHVKHVGGGPNPRGDGYETASSKAASMSAPKHPFGVAIETSFAHLSICRNGGCVGPMPL